MLRMHLRWLLFLPMGFLLMVSLAAPGAAGGGTESSPSGKQVFENKCLQCHKASKFKDLHYARNEWEQIVSRMERNTCVLSSGEFSAVCDYLAKEHGE